VVIEVILSIPYFSVDFTSSKMLLSVCRQIKNYSDSRSEVGRLTQFVEVRVLTAAISSVTVYVIQFKLNLGLCRVER
jgi:hypothetical protein